MPLRTANQGRSHIDSHQFELVHILTRVYESGFRYARGNIHSTLINSMQLLSSSDRGTRVEKPLMQTLASQLSCNSCSRLTGAWELRKLSYKLSLLNSHATLVLVWPGHESWELSCKLSLLNSHVTLVLVWPGHESWENSHTNSHFSTLINSHATLVLVWPRHENWSVKLPCKLSPANSQMILTGPLEGTV
jgi:hypothetical protein